MAMLRIKLILGRHWVAGLRGGLCSLLLTACCQLSLADNDLNRKTIIDMHVHIAGIGAHGSGCFVRPDLRDSYKFSFYLRAFGVSKHDLQSDGDAIVFQRIAERLARSKTVQQAVVLAIDGVIDDHGELDKSLTQVFVPNDFVSRETARYDNLLFGASINPHRPDAITRLQAAKAGGAVLVKWIPAIMAIDPSDRRIIPFYKKLVELDLPLLVHVGQERSFNDAQDNLGDPVKLELPLETGVTVIAAHIASTGKNADQGNFERLLPLFARYENLYTDISSLTQINKLHYLHDALQIPGLSARMIYGSDWPLQFFPLVSPWFQIGRVKFGKLLEVSKLVNPWDRDVALKRAIGVPAEVFLRTRELLKIPLP